MELIGAVTLLLLGGSEVIEAVPASAEVEAAPAAVNTPPSEPAAEPAQPNVPAGPAAQAELAPSPVQLRIYGFLNGEVEAVEAAGGISPYRSRGRVSDGNSRLGFSGEVTLVHDLQAVWQLEGGLAGYEQGGFNDQGLPATLASRNSFVGLSHPLGGRLVLGHNDSAYRTLVGSAGALGGNLGLTVTGLDVWNNTSAQGSGNADSVFSRGEARYKSSVHYDSPDVYGAKLSASLGFDEQAAQRRLRTRVALALLYAWGPVKVGVGYDHQANTGVDAQRLHNRLGFATRPEDGTGVSFYKGVASVVVPVAETSVSLGYELATYGFIDYLPPTTENFQLAAGTGDMRQAAAMASVAQPLPFGLTVMLSGAKLFELEHTVEGQPKNYRAWQFSGGLKYAFGEHFTAYGYYTRIDNGALQNTNLGQAPLYSNALGQSGAFLAPGNNPRAFGLGVLARF